MRDHEISQRRACQLVGVDPKTGRRERPQDSAEIREEMQEIAGKLSIGVECSPPIGVQKGPLWRCGEQARGGVAFQLAQPTRACVSGVFMPVF